MWNYIRCIFHNHKVSHMTLQCKVLKNIFINSGKFISSYYINFACKIFKQSIFILVLKNTHTYLHCVISSIYDIHRNVSRVNRQCNCLRILTFSFYKLSSVTHGRLLFFLLRFKSQFAYIRTHVEIHIHNSG